MFILTMSADGNVPVAFRCADGNTSDSRTHIETWTALRALAGRADFLYVADSKLCSRENMAAFAMGHHRIEAPQYGGSNCAGRAQRGGWHDGTLEE